MLVPSFPATPSAPFNPSFPLVPLILTETHDAGDVAGGITSPVLIHKYCPGPTAGGASCHPVVGATVREVLTANWNS